MGLSGGRITTYGAFYATMVFCFIYVCCTFPYYVRNDASIVELYSWQFLSLFIFLFFIYVIFME